jgi:LPXTG-motif cell wall-anchored protein
MHANASAAQYATATPTCLNCLHGVSPSPPLPHTGFAVGGFLIVGVLMIALGLMFRRVIDDD